jgi:hypothetical protein
MKTERNTTKNEQQEIDKNTDIGSYMDLKFDFKGLNTDVMNAFMTLINDGSRVHHYVKNGQKVHYVFFPLESRDGSYQAMYLGQDMLRTAWGCTCLDREHPLNKLSYENISKVRRMLMAISTEIDSPFPETGRHKIFVSLF